jgi:ATP-dependent RNA helicase DDX51/DBP6
VISIQSTTDVKLRVRTNRRSLISSDLISRGMDINHVSHVINYDTPIDIRKYIHRVGRTARAGREGDAWTLVEEQEVRGFVFLVK